MTKLKATVTFDLNCSGLLTQEQVDAVTERLQEDTLGSPVWEGCKQAAGGDAEKFLELINRTWIRREIRHSFNVPAKVTFHKEQPKPVRPVLPKEWWVQVNSPEEICTVLELLQGEYVWRDGAAALGYTPPEKCTALGVQRGALLYQTVGVRAPYSFHADGCTEVTVEQLRAALGKVAPRMPETTGKEPLQELPAAWFVEGITAEQLQELQGFKLLQELGTWISGEPFNERGLLGDGGRLQFHDGEFAHFGAFKFGTELSFDELLDYCKRNEVRAITLPKKWHVHLTSQGQLESLKCSEHLRKLGNWINGDAFEADREFLDNLPVLAYDGTEYHRERSAARVLHFNGKSHEFTFEELRGLLGDE